jgi:hypothetical protein
VDERSLVFSVGVLLFEKLTGRHPFGADGNPQRLARMQRGEMASGVNYFPLVPADLRVVLLKAMGPFPEERWNSLGELRGQLEVFIGRAREPGRGVRVQPPRPLPALPGGPEPPRRRIAAPSPTPHPPTPPLTPPPAPTPSAEIDLTRMARMTGRHSAVRADEPISAEAALRALARKLLRPRLVPGVWACAGVLVGAALTSIIFLAVWPDAPAIAERDAPLATAPAATATDTTAASATDTTAATAKATTATASAARPSPGPLTASARPPAASPPTATAKVATANTPTRAPSAPASSPAAVFSPAAGGDTALVAARACVAADRKVQFGASLYYDAASGLSRRVFYGAIEQLAPPERACLDEKLLGLSAGAAPPRAAVVTYSFHLSPAGDHVKARLNPSP